MASFYYWCNKDKVYNEISPGQLKADDGGKGEGTVKGKAMGGLVDFSLNLFNEEEEEGTR